MDEDQLAELFTAFTRALIPATPEQRTRVLDATKVFFTEGLDERSDIVGSDCLACGKKLDLPVEVSGMAWCNFVCQDVWKRRQQKGLDR